MWTWAAAQEGNWRDSGVFFCFVFLPIIIWPYWGVYVEPGLCSCKFLCTLPVQVWTCLCIKWFDFITKPCTLCSNVLCPFSCSRFLNKFCQRNRPSPPQASLCVMAEGRLNAPFRTALVSTTHATSRHLPLPVCSVFFCLFFPLHSLLLIFACASPTLNVL